MLRGRTVGCGLGARDGWRWPSSAGACLVWIYSWWQLALCFLESGKRFPSDIAEIIR